MSKKPTQAPVKQQPKAVEKKAFRA